MTLTFLQPHAAWLLLLLPVFFWWMRRRASLTHRALRAVIFGLLIAALCQPSLIRQSGRSSQVVIVDQGDRLSPEARAEAKGNLQALIARAGGPVTVIQRGGVRLDLKADGYLILPDPGEGASLTRALERAAEALPLASDGVITVISDGLSRDQDWGRAIDGLLRRGVRVDTVALPASRREAFIARVSLPTVRAGERMLAQIDVEGAGRGITLSAWTGDRRLARSQAFDLDEATTVSLQLPAEQPGFLPLRFVLEREGGAGDAYQTVAAIQDPFRIAYVGETGSAGAFQRLAGSGFRLDARPANALAALDLGAYKGVVLNDVPAADLPIQTQRRMVDAVRADGLGLFVAGGDSAFSSGGYADTPLAGALPVTLRQEEITEDPSVALAIVIDTSGSMLGNPLDLGKQVARLAVRRLGPADNVGVVEFYGGRQWVAPMQPVRDIPEVERAISRVQAQGGSEHLFEALQEAYYGLANTQARYKHILVISDAGVNADRYPQLIRHIAQDRVTVSTVQVGGDADGEARMAQWARLGRGRAYVVRDEFSLVEINLKQPQQKPEPGFKRGRIALTLGQVPFGWTDLAATPPPVEGFALTRDRPRAETILRTTSGDPVLATWQYGAGRVTALMTEPVGPATAGWRGWSGYGDWMSRLLAMTADLRPDWDVRLRRTGDRLEISAQRISGGAGTGPLIRLVNAGGQAEGPALALTERAPGLFVGQAVLDPLQPARVAVQDARGLTRAAMPALGGGDPLRPPSAALAIPLERLAHLSGGTFTAEASTPAPTSLTGPGRGDYVAFDLWSWLAWLALAVYIAEVVYRRWPTRRPSVGIAQ